MLCYYLLAIYFIKDYEKAFRLYLRIIFNSENGANGMTGAPTSFESIWKQVNNGATLNDQFTFEAWILLEKGSHVTKLKGATFNDLCTFEARHYIRAARWKKCMQLGRAFLAEGFLYVI